MEEWSCQLVSALVEQLELREYQSFTVLCCGHVVTVLASRQVLQEILDLFFDKCLEDAMEVEDLLAVVQLAATKHFELVLNKLESVYNNSATKKNKFLTFIKEKLNEDKKGKDSLLLFSCLGEAIKNAPLKELEFCCDGITKKFLYPCLFAAKEAKDKVGQEPALDCVAVLADTSRRILADNPEFRLSQRAELLHAALAILQHEAAPPATRERCVAALTSLVQLPPALGQLTRCSILGSAFSTLMAASEDKQEGVRADISKLLAEFSKQDPHSSLVEEVFTLLEEFIQTDCPQTPKALDILLEMLTHFKDGAVSEEKFSASMLGAVIPRCYAAETRQLGHKCFHLLLRIHARSAGEGATPPPTEEEGVRGQVVCQVVTGGEHLASLLASLCDHLASCGHTRGLALELVTLARDTVPVSAIPDLVTKLVTATQQEEGDQEVYTFTYLNSSLLSLYRFIFYGILL